MVSGEDPMPIVDSLSLDVSKVGMGREAPGSFSKSDD